MVVDCQASHTVKLDKYEKIVVALRHPEAIFSHALPGSLVVGGKFFHSQVRTSDVDTVGSQTPTLGTQG